MILITWFIVFILCSILAVETQNALFGGIAILSIGLLILYYYIKGNILANPLFGLILGIYLTIWGLLTIVVPMINSDSAVWIILEGFAGIIMGCSIYIGIILPLTCKKRVTATYIGAITTTTRYGIKMCAPTFSYTYEDCQYESVAPKTFSLKKLNKKYAEGEQYSIYLNHKNPKAICISRHPRWSIVWFVLLSILVAAIPFGA